MRILGLDIGERRCGIAVSDPAERISTPLCVLPMGEVESLAPRFRRVLEDWEPELIVAGLPYTLHHELGKQAQAVQRVARKVAEACGLPVEFCDERLSSQHAKRLLREGGHRESTMRGKVDMIAASIMLHTWLDRRANLSAEERV